MAEIVPSEMALGMTERLRPIHEQVVRMVADEIAPLDGEFLAEVGKAGDRWTHTKRQVEILDGLKAKARERGLWNFWLTGSQRGYGLTTVEYAYLAEEMGKAIVSLGDNYYQYARRWLEINSAMGGNSAHVGWSAAAYDTQGYWYINTPYSEGAHGKPIKAVGYDASKKPGTIMGPFPIP